ncbi:MAG: prepilin peptidase [Acidobacteria bacterium]|nr:prepilin peptidase [Acidobacteriota bacterium]
MSLAIFIFGLCVGSFLNVCIHRLPKSQSVVTPRSRCPGCGRPIAAWDNVPLLSYLLLRGRCRNCRVPISIQYPLVELLTGLSALMVYVRFDMSVAGLKAMLLACALLVLIVTDLRERLLPDRITFPGMAVGLLFALWIPVGDGLAALLARWLGFMLPPLAASLGDALLGAALGAGILFGLGELWLRLRGVEAMGMGDVKMMAMVGLFFGPKLTMLTLLLGSLGGSILGSLFILLARKDTRYELPFGTFLGAAALVALFWGEQLISAYLTLLPPGQASP